MNMNMAHIHLLVNHFPIIGSIGVAVMFAIALIFKNSFLQKLSLWFLIVVALFTALAYLSGDGATRVLESFTHISISMVHDHEAMARIGLILMFITGAISVFGVLFYTRKPALPLYFQILVMALLIISVGVFIYIGYLGGLINHPEIRASLPAWLA
ncbi:hypothetical protein [Dictyobacter arantiisoli]|uniref:DUF2231 domain-containing protein n=1 Tax=Dictyobacter arantiisoli TaxID=2014874 RepID=A0A5A5TE95_9CHLR|nr:hypothetical protein [Dictyobacter arantiisoli]GCF09466.1 hypothetical protein KDI_30300 [Dictyobacter arantiisoli]